MAAVSDIVKEERLRIVDHPLNNLHAYRVGGSVFRPQNAQIPEIFITDLGIELITIVELLRSVMRGDSGITLTGKTFCQGYRIGVARILLHRDHAFIVGHQTEVQHEVGVAG